MFYFLLSVAYDGSDFVGWVVQPNFLTVQGQLNSAIERTTKNQNFKTRGASKTDSGVHALDQKVLLICKFNPQNLPKFQKAVNKNLPETIQITEIQEVGFDFEFHTKVLQKTYTYTINDGVWNLYTQRYEIFWKNGPMDIQKLQTIANVFVGSHNFQNFSGLRTDELLKINPQRIIESFVVQRVKNRIVFEIKAKGFIRYQIRKMVAGILQAYQEKKYTSEDLNFFLKNDKLQKFPFNAPSKGLCLKKIILSK